MDITVHKLQKALGFVASRGEGVSMHLACKTGLTDRVRLLRRVNGDAGSHALPDQVLYTLIIAMAKTAMPEGQIMRKGRHSSRGKVGDRHNSAREVGSVGVVDRSMEDGLASTLKVHERVMNMDMD